MSHLENGHEHIELLEMRPRFKLRAKSESEAVRALFQAAVEDETKVHGWLTKYHMHLQIPAAEQHYWSPVLHAGVEDDEYEGGCIIRVLVGPRQQIWAMFTFFKAAIGVLGLFGGMYGLTQWQLGKSSYFLWCIPVALVLAAGVFGVAKLGQQKGRAEMEHLIRFLHRALKDAELRRDDG